MKLIALDLDGTLFNNKSQISQENIKAIKEATAAGINDNLPISSDISKDGINSDHTDAATMTPDANPSRDFCTSGFNSPVINSTQAAPKNVPTNGIQIYIPII